MAQMNNKVKGLLKGLRYISQIFDGEKEQDMQIGFPTDVKHVAHIGWDGPSVNAPSWMNEFHSAPLSTTFGADGKECATPSPRATSQEFTPEGGIQNSPVGDPSESPARPRRSRRHASSDPAGSDSPNRDRDRDRDHSSSGSRHSRRHQSASAADSPTRTESSEGSRRSRRQPKSSSSENNGTGSESPAQDLPSIPKQSRRRRAKGSDGGGGSTRLSTRSKAPSEAGLEEGSTRTVPALTSAAED